MLIPSIDLMDGQAVQLVGGRHKVLERPDVEELARRFSVYGEIAVIDLDAAMGRGDNRALVRRLCGIARCRVGGGIRDERRAAELLRAGADRLILGTAADEGLLARLPRERVLVAVDHDRGRVLSHGWLQDAGETPAARIRRLAPHCGGFLVTGIHHEGRLAGFSMDDILALRELTDRPITYAGGVTAATEVAALDRHGIDAQVGMALYTGRLDPAEAFLACLDFHKEGGRLPCVVQDAAGRVLMVAWQTLDSLREALRSGRGVYYSRRRQRLWVKGESSGHGQRLLRATADCDRDTVLFTVSPAGPACHTGAASCFGRLDFAVGDLEAVLQQRQRHPVDSSYTCRLLREPELLAAKLREEVDEVIDAAGRADDLVWECADTLYFLLVQMTAGGIGWTQVLNELERRRR
jgi:phosphoribosyl-ATP pyrophosphohydrolase